ncbi:hypothetical protein BKA65DRAFT_498417 [Rhexocercosporidium sp. MPI-PUGE-AT-0058]|nr:hypothetical protein BKA65DRAFT_498417 [Rhexocercosporidium sp. MPI-PUGE-AT-0058]
MLSAGEISSWEALFLSESPNYTPKRKSYCNLNDARIWDRRGSNIWAHLADALDDRGSSSQYARQSNLLADDTSSPGCFRTQLENGIKFELWAARHAEIMQYTFLEGEKQKSYRTIRQLSDSTASVKESRGALYDWIP